MRVAVVRSMHGSKAAAQIEEVVAKQQAEREAAEVKAKAKAKAEKEEYEAKAAGKEQAKAAAKAKRERAKAEAAIGGGGARTLWWHRCWHSIATRTSFPRISPRRLVCRHVL